MFRELKTSFVSTVINYYRICTIIKVLFEKFKESVLKLDMKSTCHVTSIVAIEEKNC